MASIQLRSSSKLEDFGNPYIVAEVNTSHFGDINIAKKMIETIEKIGCDCVKFNRGLLSFIFNLLLQRKPDS